MPLTDTAIRKARPRERPYRLHDSAGLYLEITPRGGRLWRLKYRFASREKRLALGTYPDVPLRAARDGRDEARKLLAKRIDPGAVRKVEKAARREAAENTFEAVAREWFDKKSPAWAPTHSEKIIRRFENHVFPRLGSRPIREITGPEILRLLERVAEHSPDTARRVGQGVGQVFRHAMRTHRADADPSAKLHEALPAIRAAGEKSHYASITDPTAVGALLRALAGYEGSFPVACALRLAPLVFVRPGELRAAEWSEFDLDADQPLWRIPAARMKGRREHLVPLSAQAVAILRELQPVTGRGRYVFPSIRTSARPISENTLNAGLRRLGYAKHEMTAHGFRSLASTLLNEQGFSPDVIELQLAHAERNKVRAAYNHAEHLPERRKMMQAWADFLDGLRAGAKVVPFKRPA